MSERKGKKRKLGTEMVFQCKCVKPWDKYNCCCCGCSLRTGTLIIAWLGVISGFLCVLKGITGIVLFDGTVPETQGLLEDTTADEYTASLAINILLGIISMVCDGLLLYATKLERVKILEVIVIVKLISVIGTAVVLVYGILTVIQFGAVTIIMYALMSFLLMGIMLWLWIIVYSFYRQVFEHNTGIQQTRDYILKGPEADKLNLTV